MPATANKPYTAVCHELADIERINGKVFTMNMVYTYALIEGYQTNGQTAYFSQDMLKRRLGVTRQTVVKLLADMVAMGLINKTAQIGGKTCHYTVNPITPAMLGTVEPEAEATPAAPPEAPQEQPQRATAEREEVQEPNHTAEPVEAPEAPEIVPATPGPEAPITLMTVYSEKVETVDQPGETASVVPVVADIVPAFAYPRGEIKEVSDYDFGDPW
ncbi:TPA: MarR family transcriptional regulator [Enterobacter hormaechei]